VRFFKEQKNFFNNKNFNNKTLTIKNTKNKFFK